LYPALNSYKKTFLKKLNKLRDRKLKDRIAGSIADVEDAKSLSDLNNLKKLEGFSQFYRIRTGSHRIGI